MNMIHFICQICGKDSTLSDKCLASHNNEKICTTCRKKNTAKNIDWNERYKKTLITCIERYGVDNPNKDKAVRDKIKQTCLQKYGCINGGGSLLALEKSKHTCLERYGVIYSFLADNVKLKIKETCLKHYGVDSYLKTDIAKERSRNWIKSLEFKDKNINTCLQKYGCTNGGASLLAHLKIHRKYTYDSYTFDSSWEIILYIYLKDHNINFLYLPNIYFTYNINNKYYPDFLINEKFYEIKGDLFFDKNGNMINPFDRNKDELYEKKHLCMLTNNVTILREKDIKPYMTYVFNKYGKEYISKFRN